MSTKLARGILPALCTPFDDSGQQLETSLVKGLTDSLLDAGCRGLFICGGTGEGGQMSSDERRKMTEAPVDRPHDLVAAAEHYAAIGGATNLPFYVYWLQAQADKTITPGQYLEAMETVPNFTGIKYTDTNFFFFQQLIDLSGGEINAITGPDEMCLSGMVMGSDGSIGSTYNIMPRLFVRMRSDFENGRIEAAMEAQRQANKVISALIRAGVLPAVKELLSSRGLRVGPTRPPFEPLTPEAAAHLHEEIDSFDFEVA